ncbi:MAG: tRNA lysidine(34) synthetase TilS [Xanthomonadales bacterium]
MNARRQGEFSRERLLEHIARLPRPRRYWVGFSGGADSTALLQALFESRDRLAAPLHAIHFHHGLQPSADAWLMHCEAFCRERGIPFRGERLEIAADTRSSPEEAARKARYRVAARLLRAEELLLTAHHLQDQAETLFLNLMRGSGIEGLAGIPPLRKLGRGWVGRPLLEVERTELERWLRERAIEWLEDASNADVAFDRNFLRHELFPLLETRWPGLDRRLARTARHARQSAAAMAGFIGHRTGELLDDSIRLPVRALLELDPAVRSLILREWLRRNELPALPETRINEFLQQLAGAGSARHAEVRWGDWMIKRYRDDLWLHPCLPELACAASQWQNAGRVTLGAASGTLSLTDQSISPPGGWTVGPRRVGARFRQTVDGPSRTLKHCFQACGVPPWLRPAVPVLYWDDEPVALGDGLVSDRLRRWLDAHEVALSWRPNEPVLERIREHCRITRL